jgi:hypothetical protein
MTFSIVPPERPRKPIPLYQLMNRLIWRTHTITVTATAIEGPALYVDYVLRGLVDALRDAANRIEEHQRHLLSKQREAKGN